MSRLLFSLWSLIVIGLLAGCNAEAAQVYSLEGKSESWVGSMTIEEGDLKEEVSEMTNWELAYTGESVIGTVNVHYPVDSDVAAGVGKYSLDGDSMIKEELEDQRFLSLLQTAGKISFEIEWIDNGRPIREKIEFVE